MELSSTLSISVRQGVGNYVKLLREKNRKSWWINLSSSLFEKILLMKGEIQKWMQTGEEKECLKMGTVAVQVKVYEGEHYFCFEKKNGEFVNRINLNGKEWVRLHQMMDKIMGQLDPKKEIFEKPFLVRYYPKHGEVFYFHEASAAADYPGVKILKKKLTPPTNYEFMLMGISYVVREMIKTYSRKNCEGCFMGYLSQLDHNLCLVEWGDQVDNYYHRVKSTLKEEKVVEFFEGALKSLGIDESISFERIMSMEDKEIMDVVKPVNYPREYEMLFKPFVKEEEM